MPNRNLSSSLPAALGALALLLVWAERGSAAVPPPHGRVVVVVMENKSYDQVRTQPYTTNLQSQGATFTNSFGITHPSQPNYIAMWAASLLGVTNNNCPATGAPFSAENLGHACEAAGLTWRAYTDLAADIAGGTLPNLAFIIPNNCHNTHNSSTPGCTVPDGDAWLAANLPAVIAALGPTGLLVLTWDEDDSVSGNHILTVFVGPQVVPGAVSSQLFTHYTLARMICETLGLAPFANGVGETPVAGIWTAVSPTLRSSWGKLKASYR